MKAHDNFSNDVKFKFSLTETKQSINEQNYFPRVNNSSAYIKIYKFKKFIFFIVNSTFSQFTIIQLFIFLLTKEK